MDISNLLEEDYEKILVINLKNGTFKEQKVNEEEKVNYSGINQWFIQFVNSGAIDIEDKRKFLNFANIIKIKQALAKNDKIELGYKRNGKWAVMTIRNIPREDELALLTVRYMDDIYDLVEEKMNFFKPLSLEEILNYIQNRELSSCGIVVVEYDDEDIPDVAKFYSPYYKLFSYKNNYYILLLENLTCDEFQLKLSQIYENFKVYNINYGTAWTDDDNWDVKELFLKASAELQINKEKIGGNE